MKITPTIKLNNGTEMPRLGLGVYQIPDGPSALNSVRWALEAGYRHIDTAKLYGNEASVGRAIRDSGIDRDQVWVTTKLWPTDFWRPEAAFQKSLERLDLGYIDLYLIHWPLPGVPMFRVWQAMERIYRSGATRSIGVSNFSAGLTQSILDKARVAPAVNQVRASVLGYDSSIYELCQQTGVVFEAYSPLTQARRLNNQTVAEIAGHYHKTPAQIFLRWALQKNMVVIPRSQNRQRIQENAAIFDFEISGEDMAKLDQLSR